jgi:putative FmdB family regulatory protein
MPLYEYLCDAGHRFEKIVQFSDPPLEACPNCGGKVQKLFSSPAIQFKGSGFYITDYPKKQSADAASDGKSSSETSSSEKEKPSGGKSPDASSAEKSKSTSDSASSASAPAASTAKD